MVGLELSFKNREWVWIAKYDSPLISGAYMWYHLQLYIERLWLRHLQLENCDVILRPPVWCKTNVLINLKTVKGALCVWGKGGLQWINQQRVECCCSRRVNLRI